MPQESQYSFWRFNLQLFLLTSFTFLTLCSSFPTSLNNDDIRITSFVSQNSESQSNQRKSSFPLNTASWSSVFITSEFRFPSNRKVNFSSSSSHSQQPQTQLFPSSPSFESNFNLLQQQQDTRNQEESLEDTFLNAIDDISRGLRCHPTYSSKGNY